jgi:hypothetical protein
MSELHANIDLSVAVRTNDPIPEVSALDVLGGARDISKYHPDAKFEVRVGSIQSFGAERVVDALRNSGIRISRCLFTPTYSSDYWSKAPDDCVGGLLKPDGHLGLVDPNLYWRILPLSEPLYCCRRPEADAEHSRFKPDVLGHAGGIPIVSDGMLSTLRSLGAVGETATIIYRGPKRAALDTVQEGFKRFLIRPEHDMPILDSVEVLPVRLPDEFGICCMRRVRTEPLIVTYEHGSTRNLAEDSWYEIAISIRLCDELRRMKRNVLLTPIFRHGGPTHDWFCQLKSALDALKR